MTLLDTTRIAVRALWRNKLRSFLTALGIVIGVAAVIAMVAIGEGARAKVEEQFSAMGSNLLIVMPGTSTTSGARGGSGTQPTLTWDDLKAIQTEVSSVHEAAPQLRSSSQIMSEDSNWSTQIYGVTPEYFSIRTWGIATGSAFSRTDVDGGLKIALLGQTVVDKLYLPGVDPVGQTVRIRNIPFIVAGVMEKKGQSSYGSDFDDAVFIPVSTFRARIQGGLPTYLMGSVFVSANTADTTAKAERQIRELLRSRHHLEEGVDDDFFVRNMTELASAAAEGTKTLTALLASVAAVSLLIGGIGIMNIMLVSVTERTREIGIRMAVGARPFDIMAQFLIEALALSVLGGLIGIALGLFSAHRLATEFDWPMLIRPAVIGIAVGFSALVGIGFGLYPARKAAQLDPIEALRYE
jgi:putative ABC transport system permease protein